jgi:hypothetical protein
MIGTKLIAATVAGAAVGAGTFALAPTQAATGSSSSSSSSSDSSRSAVARSKNVIHGSWVTRNRVHHESIRGVVRTVNSSFITVRALDGYTQTYHVTRTTKVRVLRDGHKGLDKIGDVKVGDRALVAGTGNDQATHVIARQPKPASGATTS